MKTEERNEHDQQIRFYQEMAAHQLSANEFFCQAMLESLERNFGRGNAVIFYFDTHGQFLSWVTKKGLETDSPKHPYREFFGNDVVRYRIYQEAVRDHLTYFNVVPRLYRATDIINAVDYENSAYVRFLEEKLGAHYSVTLAFGINGYIQISFLKTMEQGDFTEQDMKELSEIYLYIANGYKTFKKYEQQKIISTIKSRIIENGEKAYLVTDDFHHIMDCNEKAQRYLEDILGSPIDDQIGNENMNCTWLAFLMDDLGQGDLDIVKTRVVKNFIIKVYTYDQTYSNRIVDRYHWITIHRQKGNQAEAFSGKVMPLTQAEQRVAELMYNGMTYKQISEELVVSYHTVKKHVQNIYSKCGVNSRYQLYKWIESQES